MRSIQSLPLALLLLIPATFAAPTDSRAQAAQDRPTPNTRTQPIEEPALIDARTPLRQRIADAIAALKAAGRTPYRIQRAASPSAPLAWTRRGAR